jgi:hypothetical protein
MGGWNPPVRVKRQRSNAPNRLLVIPHECYQEPSRELMTEQAWETGTFPQNMLEFLNGGGRASDRKLRLFACACCRRIWDLLPDERSRAVVVVAERFADGLATPDQLRASHRLAREVSLEQRRRNADDPHQFVSLAASDTAYPSGYSAATSATVDAAWNPVKDETGSCVREAEWTAQAGIVRDLFGNPFRTIIVDARWQTPVVTALAETIYDQWAFDRLPILADALQDAGCENVEVLNHCRSDGPHVRGCWVLDLLTGRK